MPSEDARMRQVLHTQIIRKMRLAGWQASYPPAVAEVKHLFLTKRFGVSSSRDLTEDQLIDALNTLATMEFTKPINADFKCASSDQIRKIVRIGKHVLGDKYGPTWYLSKVAEWVNELHQGEAQKEISDVTKKHTVRTLNQLTRSEAYYVIQRLEKIEFALWRKGKKA